MKRQTGFCLGGDPDIDAVQIVLAPILPYLELLSKECPGSIICAALASALITMSAEKDIPVEVFSRHMRDLIAEYKIYAPRNKKMRESQGLKGSS